MSLLRFWALIVLGSLLSMGGFFSSKISSFAFWKWTKVLQVWNDMRVSNSWNNLYFWLNCPFKDWHWSANNCMYLVSEHKVTRLRSAIHILPGASGSIDAPTVRMASGLCSLRSSKSMLSSQEDVLYHTCWSQVRFIFILFPLTSVALGLIWCLLSQLPAPQTCLVPARPLHRSDTHLAFLII